MTTPAHDDFFDHQDLEALRKLFDVAEANKNSDGFLGEIARVLIPFKDSCVRQEYLDQLNRELSTIKKHTYCKIQRAWDGGFNNFQDADNLFRLERILICLCIYLREASFRGNFIVQQSHGFYPLLNFFLRNRTRFSEKSYWAIDFYDDLPTLIMQAEFHSEHAIALAKALPSIEIGKVQEFISTKDEALSKIESWKAEFEDKEKKVNALKEKLDTYTTAFNFVGLYQGFASLKEVKDQALVWANKRFYLLGGLLVLLPCSELIYALLNIESLKNNPSIIGFIAFPTISMLVILFYLLKVCLNNLYSIRSQILQLELRMTLCQFIQSYAEHSKTLKENNKEGFEKFENLIFSSIVSTDEKIPATFDGMEQLTSLLKSIKS
ncbi:hypothetical protein LVY74_09410 [Acinetobacter sp. ME22]|uniref:hypothetical protein n=1 Tax=Acinetobacter sp. ME22 TaxID=2904802 RepID=UPI001EDAAD96|nr:hypothetical protein [Acinetobacter sp. ME22]MCG2573775.1 hypothetical protein [Acinetobacter sp. ME22]